MLRIMLLLRDVAAVLKEPLREGVILSLNPVVFLFPD